MLSSRSASASTRYDPGRKEALKEDEVTESSGSSLLLDSLSPIQISEILSAEDKGWVNIKDEAIESSGSSHLLDSLAPCQGGEMLSAEDKAWIDSCLIKEHEISDNSWNSKKEVLLDILSNQTESLSSSEYVHDDFAEEISMIQISKSSYEAETESFSGTTLAFSAGTSNTSFPMTEEVETDESKLDDNTSNLPFVRNPFLPSYSEDLKETEIHVIGPKYSSVYEVEQSTDDIFKIWDLGIPGEEDDLGKQLNKALEKSSNQVQLISQNVEDSGPCKDLKKESIDYVIDGITDLSLMG